MLSARRAASRRATSTSTSTTTPAARRSRTPRTTGASPCPQGMAVTERRRRRSTSRRSARARSASSTPAQLENDTFVPSAATRSRSAAAAPPASCSTRTAGQLYVLTRFDNAISIVDTGDAARRSRTSPMHNPEPPSVVRRPPLPLRRLALVEPRRLVLRELPRLRRHRQPGLGSRQPGRRRCSTTPGPFERPALRSPGSPWSPIFHPMKGPMTTQSLRGMANHGPMHWRGDRTGGNDAPSAQPDSGAFDERAALQEVPGRLRRSARAREQPITRQTWRRSPTSSSRSRIRRTRSGTSTTRSPPISRPGATSS